ncbi:hypothetical protein ACFVUP_38340 [Streptomyces bacillaris]|uniref:hypothetical protein n=1 Tax=Streptomyces bacillaris TaxID=68179 RepID=UPI0036DEE765
MGDLVSVMKRSSSDVRFCPMIASFIASTGSDCAAAIAPTASATPSEHVGPPSTVLTVTAVPRVRLVAEAAVPSANEAV